MTETPVVYTIETANGNEVGAFAYDDDKQSIVVEQRFSEAQTLMRQGLTSMIEAGGKFAEIRDLLRHNKAGGFEAWRETKGLARDTVYRLINTHAAFATVANLRQLDIAASAAYLLAAPSVPDEARQEAIQRAEAGEKITVAAAKVIVAEHQPAQPAEQYATMAQLEAAVRTWLPTYTRERSGQLAALNNIRSGNSVGESTLAKLIDSGCLPRPFRLKPDVLIACGHVLAEMTAPPPGRAVAFQPAPVGDNWTPVHTLEQNARLFLALNIGPLGSPQNDAKHLARWYATLEGIRDHTEQGQSTLRTMLADKHIQQPAQLNALRQACHNILDQLRQAEARRLTAAAVEVEPQPEPTDVDLPAIVLTWLDERVENLDLADDQQSRVYCLEQVIKARNGFVNGSGAEAWKDLRACKDWPAGADNDLKMRAVRGAIARLRGEEEEPETEVQEDAEDDAETVESAGRGDLRSPAAPRPHSWDGVKPVAGGPGSNGHGKRPAVGSDTYNTLLDRKTAHVERFIKASQALRSWALTHPAALEDDAELAAAYALLEDARIQALCLD